MCCSRTVSVVNACKCDECEFFRPMIGFYTTEISAHNVRCKCVVSAEHVLTRYGPREFCVLIGQLNWGSAE